MIGARKPNLKSRQFINMSRMCRVRTRVVRIHMVHGCGATLKLNLVLNIHVENIPDMEVFYSSQVGALNVSRLVMLNGSNSSA